MSGQAAEIQARLAVQCNDLITFFVEGGIQKHSVDLLALKLESHDTLEV